MRSVDGGMVKTRDVNFYRVGFKLDSSDIQYYSTFASNRIERKWSLPKRVMTVLEMRTWEIITGFSLM